MGRYHRLFSEADPLGVAGSFLLDQLEDAPDHFRFKHHYILHALDSQPMLQLAQAIGQHRRVRLTNASGCSNQKSVHSIYPLRIFISTQGGRQYLLCHHYGFRKLMFFRLDYIQTVEPGNVEANFKTYEAHYEKFQTHLWGTSGGSGFRVDHLEMTICYGPQEDFILRRLEREKRNGVVEILDDHTCRYTADVYDAAELIPWMRTFIGRILDLQCSNPAVTERFYDDLKQMAGLYGGA